MRLAKLSKPRTNRAIARPRLFRLLDQGRQHPLTWVSGPPGAGKTTILASYLQARNHSTLWYQVDAGDRDIATFFYYLAIAAPRGRQLLPRFAADDRDVIEAFSRRFFRTLYARCKAPFAIVLDNYQDAPEDCLLHKVMTFAAAEIPEGVRIYVASRSEPPPELIRLRANDQVHRIDWEQLKFTRNEARQLASRMKRGLAAKTVESLRDNSDGWAAGLMLLLEQVRRDGDIGRAPDQGSRELLFDYFATQLFSGANEQTRRELMELSFLPIVDAATASELTGRKDVSELLERLHRNNFFTSKRGTQNPTYQFHPLFTEFLQAQAARAFSAARMNAVRVAAAKLAVDRGDFPVAMSLLHAARQFDAMALMLTRWAPELLAQWRLQTYRQWLDLVPAELIESTPWLLYWRGRAWTEQSYEDCQRDCDRALALFRERGDVDGMHAAWSASVFAHTYQARSFGTVNRIKVFDELRRVAPRYSSPDLEIMATLAAIIAASAARWPCAEIDKLADRVIELTAKAIGPTILTHAAAICILHYLCSGRLARGAKLAQRMRAILFGRNCDPQWLVSAAVGLSAYEAGAGLSSYKETGAQTRSIADAAELHNAVPYMATCFCAWAALSDGELEFAKPWLDALDRDLRMWGALDETSDTLRAPFRNGVAAWSRWLRVLEDLEKGDALSAERRLPELQELEGAAWSFDWASALLLSMAVAVARDQKATALEFLARAQAYARVVDNPYCHFMTECSAAHLHLTLADRALGLEHLRTGFAIGHEHQLFNSHVWRPSVMSILCAHALAENIERAYAVEVIRRRRLKAPGLNQHWALLESWPWPVRIYTLGRFSILIEGEPLKFAGRVQHRPLELLQAIIAFGARDVSCDRITDALWPDAEADAAADALAKTLRRLRSILPDASVVALRDNKLSLDVGKVWIDKLELERALNASKDAVDAARIVRLYQGDFLAKEMPAWLIKIRERLRQRVLATLTRAETQRSHTSAAPSAELAAALLMLRSPDATLG